MEVIQRLIIITLLGALQLASTTADIMVQPGYKPNQKVPNNSEKLKSPTPEQHEASLAEEFERYKNLHRTVEEQLVHLIHEQYVQNLQQAAPGLVGYPLLYPRVLNPILPSIGGGRLYSLTPHGAHGLHVGGYGIRRRPLLLRETEEPSQQENNAARTQWTRSVDGGPGYDSRGDTEVYDVAAQSAVSANQDNGVVEFQVPEIPSDESIDKLVEPRQIGQRDDAIVGSPLDNIHYESPNNNNDQHHPSKSSGLSSNILKAVNAVGNMIDAVAPGVMNYENKDSASAMTRHQDPASNYRHNSQYPLNQLLGTGSPSNWNAPSTSSNSQTMTGQSYNGQQNSGWSSNTQSSTSPKSNNQFSQQAPAAFPAAGNLMNAKNWLTAMRTHLPGYYPDHHNYYGHPPTGNYPYHGPSPYPEGASPGLHRPSFGSLPFVNGPSYPSSTTSSATATASNQPGLGPYNHGLGGGTSSATASATANAGNSGYNYPYRSAYNNAYSTYNPYIAATNLVDQYGRSLLRGIPSSINSLSTNAGNYNAYLKNYVQNQMAGIYRQPGYVY